MATALYAGIVPQGQSFRIAWTAVTSITYHRLAASKSILCLQIVEVQKVTEDTKISMNQEFCFLLFFATSVYAGSLKQQ